MQIPGQADLRQPETGQSPGSMNSFSSLLLWILGGATPEGLNSLFSMFRDVREQERVYANSTRSENRANQDVQLLLELLLSVGFLVLISVVYVNHIIYQGVCWNFCIEHAICIINILLFLLLNY